MTTQTPLLFFTHSGLYANVILKVPLEFSVGVEAGTGIGNAIPAASLPEGVALHGGQAISFLMLMPVRESHKPSPFCKEKGVLFTEHSVLQN